MIQMTIHNPVNMLIGTVAAIMAWSVVVSASHADIITGLTGHWKFEEVNGTSPDFTTPDSTGNGYTGDLTGLTASDLVGGVDGNALDFTGSGNYVTADLDDDLPDGNEARTIAMWVKANSTDGFDRVFAVGNSPLDNGSTTDFTIENHEGSPFVYFKHRGGNIRYPDVPIGDWFHLVFVVPSGAINCDDALVYIDGDLKSGTASYAGHVVLDTDTGGGILRIGVRGTDGAASFNGLLDDVRVYNRALSQDDIETLAAIPEPSTLFLLASAVIGLSVFGWRAR